MSRLFRSRRPGPRVHPLDRRAPRRPYIELLEARSLLAIITVNTTADPTTIPSEDTTLSLREAIEISNGTLPLSSLTPQQLAQVSGPLSNPNTIDFAIPTTDEGYIPPPSGSSSPGVWAIHPASPLDTITNPVIINGYSQPGSTPNTSPTQDNAVLTIELVGDVVTMNQFFDAPGLTIGVGNVVVEGLDINQFPGAGISIQAGSGSTITGNFIGTDPTGESIPGNLTNGVEVVGGSNNTIGGASPAARNIISGNGTTGLTNPTGTSGSGVDLETPSNLVQGNFIGVDAMADKALGNGSGSDAGVSIQFAADNTIGGTVSGAANLISGNAGFGVSIQGPDAPGNVVQGNFIGTDFGTGTIAGNSFIPLGNTVGVQINEASGNTIGGTATGAGNLIADSQITNFTPAPGVGVYLFGPSATGNLVQGNAIGQPFIVGSQVGTGASIGNEGDGIFIQNAPSNTIGGSVPLSTSGGLVSGSGNLIADNGGIGVDIALSAHNQVLGNWIGTDPLGRVLAGNTGDGVFLSSSPGNTIGGTAAGLGNLIAFNGGNGVNLFGPAATNNVLLGNQIGLFARVSKGNAGDGVLDAGPDNTIGGAAAGAGNLISTNIASGIEVSGATVSGVTGTVIQGNKIGTDPLGQANASYGNEQEGILLTDVAGNTVGGTASGAGNVIADNGTSGIQITGVQTSSGASNANSNVVQGNRIGLDASGNAGGNGVDGLLLIEASDNTIGGTVSGAGNVISANRAAGIVIDASDSNMVQGNLIGTDASGIRSLGNISDGVILENTSYSSTSLTQTASNTIGGTVPAARNIISGNLNGVSLTGPVVAANFVEGNYIGTDITGTKFLSNARDGVLDEGVFNTIGGGMPGAGNVISGNGLNGIEAVNGSDTQISGNFIGVDATGLRALGNTSDGVLVETVFVEVGGFEPGDGNVISGNGGSGVHIFGVPPGSLNPNQSTAFIVGNLIGVGADGLTSVSNLANGVFIDNVARVVVGTASGGGNVISGNGSDGVLISGSAAQHSFVEGNLLGTGGTGKTAVGNTQDGVLILDAGDNTIGGSVSGAGNVISGNSAAGVEVRGSGATGNSVQQNVIGLDGPASQPVGNATGGVLIVGATQNTFEGNIVSGNQGNGIALESGASSNSVLANNVGLDVTGRVARGNQLDGILIETASNNAIRGNVISANDLNGVEIRFTGATGNVVGGNLIGTDVTGTLALGNVGDGVVITAAPSNVIGGATLGDGNLIAGNTHGINISGVGPAAGQVFSEVVSGNTIGTDVTGTVALGNTSDGILVNGATSVLIGGPIGAMRNILSGNAGAGVQLQGAALVSILGNAIGTNAAGSAAIPNVVGVAINTSTSNFIGGPTATPGQGVGNLISGNTSAGIEIFGQDAMQNQVVGNLIGTDSTGNASLSDGSGVVLVDVAGNTIGGPSALFRNVISGNVTAGVYLFDTGSISNVVQGNYIGTNLAGTAAIIVPGGLNGLQNLGVFLNDAPGNLIGDASSGLIGGASGARNLISGNVVGIQITGATGRGNVVAGNFVGTGPTGTTSLGNQVGVFINNAGAGASVGGNVPTVGNVILHNVVSGNTSTGVQLFGPSATGNLIEANYIGLDVTGSVALPGETQSAGVFIESAPGNTIGGSSAATRNVISGNAGVNGQSSAGVYFFSGSAGNVVTGNFIGTDASGSRGIGNGAYGVLLFNAPNNTVDRSNTGNNRLTNPGGIAAFREFSGPVSSASTSPAATKAARVKTQVRATGHPGINRAFLKKPARGARR